jgi:macrolide transport system ATP-binding/permease protein
VLAAFTAGRPGYAEEQRARLLSYGLFRPDDLDTPVGALSQGQLRRLGLARLLSAPAALLLLDEPTNHLSPTLAEELEEALAEAISIQRRVRVLVQGSSGRTRRPVR